jgi:hypothetical protein
LLSVSNFEYFAPFCSARTALRFLIEDFFQLKHVLVHSIDLSRGTRIDLQVASAPPALAGARLWDLQVPSGGAPELQLQSTKESTLLAIIVSSA